MLKRAIFKKSFGSRLDLLENFSMLLLVALILFGCRSRNGEGEDPRISILGENTANLTAIASMADDFTESTGIEVEVHPLSFEDAYEKSNADFSQNTGIYDIVMQYNFSLASFVRNGYVLTVDEYKEHLPENIENIEEQLFPRAWKEVGFYKRVKGQELLKVGYPFATNTMLMVYNKNLFDDPKERAAFRESYGYNLRPPSTWEQYRDIAEFFTRPEDNLHGVILSGATGSWLYYEFTNFLFGQGGTVMEKQYGWQSSLDHELKLLEPQAIKAARFFKSLKPFNAGPFFTVGQFEKRELFAKGNIAMAFMWSDVVPALIWPSAGSLDERFGFAPIPGDKSILAGGAFFINRDSDSVPEAAQFIGYLLQPETQSKMTARGLSSGMKTVYNDAEVLKLPYSRALHDSLERGVYMLEAGPDADLISNILTEELQKVWKEERTVEKALGSAQQRVSDQRKELLEPGSAN